MAKKKEGAPGLVEQIRNAIRDSGQSLNQLSKLCGVDSGRLSRFMRGERELSLGAAEKVCQALHLSLAQLPGQAPPPGPGRKGEGETKPPRKGR